MTAWMNRFDVENAMQLWCNDPKTGDTPNLAILATALNRLMNWVDAHSDGWPYWTLPSRAAERVQETLQDAETRYRDGSGFEDIPIDEVVEAVQPVITFLQRSGKEADKQLDDLAIGEIVGVEYWPDDLVPYGLQAPWPLMQSPSPEELVRFVKEWPDPERVVKMISQLLSSAEQGQRCVTADHEAGMAQMVYLQSVASDRAVQMQRLEQENHRFGIVAEMVSAEAQKRSEVLERVCEQALQGGKHGVMCTDYAPQYLDRVVGLPSWEIEVSPEVPYGEIAYRRVFDKKPAES